MSSHACHAPQLSQDRRQDAAENQSTQGTLLIPDARTGSRIPIDELKRQPLPAHVWSVGSDFKLFAAPVRRVVNAGVNPSVRLQTRTGRYLTLSRGRRLLTSAGWKPAGALGEQDWVALARVLPVQAREEWPKHKVILLARLLADGNFCHPSTVYYYKQNRVALEEVKEMAEQFPQTTARIQPRRNNTTPQVVMNRGRQVQGRCGLSLWISELGLHYRKATEKFVPADVFRLTDDQIALFLGRLWAGDGSLGDANQSAVYYATSSPQLCLDVRHLLLRLGIGTTTRAKQFAYRGGYKIGYTVLVAGDGALARFVRLIAPHMKGREEQVAGIHSYPAEHTDGRASLDVVPREFSSEVDRTLSDLGWTRGRAKPRRKAPSTTTRSTAGNG